MSRRSERGVALLMVLGVVVLIGLLVAVAMSWSQNDRSRTGKLVHNATVQQLTESTLQFGRGYYAQNYAKWNTHLAYFIPARTVAKVKEDHPELFAPIPADSGYDCYTYAKDDYDELPPAANNPASDNNMRILVGAFCLEKSPPPARAALQAELVAPLEYNPGAQSCQAQFSGGTQGVNNCSTVAAYR
jgi:hypothetical protein